MLSESTRARIGERLRFVYGDEVAAGAADRSYGIHVARLAGLPAPVVARAEEVLQTLERGEQSGAVTRLIDDLPLFQAAAQPKPGLSEPEASAGPHPALEVLEGIDPDDMTPREALDALYRLIRLIKDAG